MSLPRNDDNSLDYNMMDYFFDKHGDLSNYGTHKEVLEELLQEDNLLHGVYNSYIMNWKNCERILKGASGAK